VCIVRAEMTTKLAPEQLVYIYIAMAGESQQGGPGCTFVDADEGRALYVKSEKLSPATFRQEFVKMQQEDSGVSFFVVTKQSGQLHVFRYPRADALKQDWTQVQEEIRGSSKTSAVALASREGSETHAEPLD